MADGRQLLNRARAESRAFRKNFGEAVSTQMLSSRMGQFVHLHTCYGHLRPFGAAMMVAGWDPREKTHQLYMTDPSGMTMVRRAARGEARRTRSLRPSAAAALQGLRHWQGPPGGQDGD